MTLWRDQPGVNSTFICRGPGCGRRLRDGMVFCVEHWNALPREHRDGIYAGKRKPEKYPDAVKAAIGWLDQKAIKDRDRWVAAEEARENDGYGMAPWEIANDD